MKVLATISPLCCAPGAPPLAPEERERLANRFKALADPARVGIVNLLSSADEVCVCELNASFDLSQPTISHHLRVLRDAGVVDSERQGLWVYYYVLPGALDELAAWLG